MKTISNVVFENETVCMDDTHFENCTLVRCVLEYSGKEMTLERTEFRDCRIKLKEEAGRTLNFLQCLGYGESTAEAWLPTAEALPGVWAPMAKPN